MIAAKLTSVGFLLLNGLPGDHPHVVEDTCLSTSYFGTYGSQSIFLPRASCYGKPGFAQLALAGTTYAFPPCFHSGVHGNDHTNQARPREDCDYGLAAASLEQSHTGNALPWAPEDELVWVEEAAIDKDLLPGPWPAALGIEMYLDKGLSQLRASDKFNHILQDTIAVSGRRQPYTVLHLDAHTALIALSQRDARNLSSILPPTWRIYPLPREPMPLLPVPKPAVERVRAILSDLRFDPIVARVVDSISVPQIKSDVRWLSGEDPESPIVSRHSFSKGALLAADWLKEQYESTGAVCELRPFLQGFAPNVICRYPATINTTATVLISGHYDSRGSFGSPRAPGADDDASGSTGVLSIARTIGRLGITFRSNVELVAFAGEEQGLYGSRYYARDLRDEDKNLTLMIQADMTAYHAPGEPMQLGMPEFIGTPEVTQLVANISTIYSPELTVGFSPACCSDHQSFHQQGFPATHVFERAGPIADPMYHNSGDLSDREGYDFNQLKSIAKVQFATLLHTAGFDIPSDA